MIPLGLPLVGGIAAAALVAGAVGGYRYADAQCEAAQAKALEKAQAAFQEQLDRQQEESASYEGERQDAAAVHIVRDGEIRTIYRTVAVDADCAAPDAVRGVLQGAVDHANLRAARESGGAVQPDP